MNVSEIEEKDESYGIDISAEQLAYAKLLNICGIVALVTLVGSFVAYLSGTVEPHIALSELPEYWSLPLDEYLERTQIKAGWGWVKMFGAAEFLTFVPIVMLPAIPIICYMRVLPIFVREKQRVYARIIIAEIAILLLAASGVLTKIV